MYRTKVNGQLVDAVCGSPGHPAGDCLAWEAWLFDLMTVRWSATRDVWPKTCWPT
jgi:hypothetical protein